MLRFSHRRLFGETPKFLLIGPAVLGLSFLLACSDPKNPSAKRFPASELAAPETPVNESPYPQTGFSYSAEDIRRAISPGGGGDIMGGTFLAASPKDILAPENLDEIIQGNADAACVVLGARNNLKHERAVDYSTAEYAGPLSLTSGGSPQTFEGQGLFAHDAKQKFCQRVEGFPPKLRKLYDSNCAAGAELEVLPLHFTQLVCDNPSDSDEQDSPQRERRRQAPGETTSQAPGSRTVR